VYLSHAEGNVARQVIGVATFLKARDSAP
jgi:hypothetical protein